MLSLSSRSCIRLNYYSLCNFDWCIMPSWRYWKEFINVHKLQTMVRWLRICKFYQIDTIFTVIDFLSLAVSLFGSPSVTSYELRQWLEAWQVATELTIVEVEPVITELEFWPKRLGLFFFFGIYIYIYIYIYINPIMDHKGLVPFEHTTFELGNIMDHKNSLLLSHLQRRCFIIYHAIA